MRRAMWVRLLTGTVREGIYHWIGSDPTHVPSWVTASTPEGLDAQMLTLAEPFEIPAVPIDPLQTLGAGGTVSVTIVGDTAARRVFAPDLLTAPSGRRVAGLVQSVNRAETEWLVRLAAGTTLETGAYLTLEGEIVRVVAGVEGGVSGAVLPVEVERGCLGTWGRGHAAVRPLGSSIQRLDRCDASGAWVEVGTTDVQGGAATEVLRWRGQLRGVTISHSQRITLNIDSLLQALRTFRPVYPQHVGERPIQWWPESRQLSWYVSAGDLAVDQWQWARVVAGSGDWFVVRCPSYSFRNSRSGIKPEEWSLRCELRVWDGESEPVPGDIVQVGSSDGLMRYDGLVTWRFGRGASANEQTASGREVLMFEFAAAVCDDVVNVEWAGELRADVAAGVPVADIVRLHAEGSLAIAGAELPSAASPWAWPGCTMNEGAEGSVLSEAGFVFFLQPDAALMDYLAAVVLRPLCLWCTDDMGLLRLLSWVNPRREDAAVEVSRLAGDDRSRAWLWNSSKAVVQGIVELEDPTTDITVLRELGVVPRRSFSFEGGREDRRIAQRRERIVSDVAVVNGSANLQTVTCPWGITDAVRRAWGEAVGLFVAPVPVLEVELADPTTPLVGRQMIVELDVLPVARRTVGWVLAASRRLYGSTTKLRVLLPFVGRENIQVWAVHARVLEDVVAGELHYEDASTNPRHLIEAAWALNPSLDSVRVLRGDDLEERGVLTGVSFPALGKLYWTGRIGDPPEPGDVLTLPVRGVVATSPTPPGSTYGYVADAPPQEGDAQWL